MCVRRAPDYIVKARKQPAGKTIYWRADRTQDSPEDGRSMNREDFQEGVGESRYDKQRKGEPRHHDPVGLVHARTLSQGPRPRIDLDQWVRRSHTDCPRGL
jgi:hypothetical protein